MANNKTPRNDRPTKDEMDRCIRHVSRFARSLNTTAPLMCDAWLDGNMTGIRAETLIRLCVRYGTTVFGLWSALNGLDD